MRLQMFLDVSYRAAECDPEDLELGDVVFQKIDDRIVHAMIVSNVIRYRGQYHEATDNFQLSYHSRDMLNRPLREILKQYDSDRVSYEYWKIEPQVRDGRRTMMANEGTPASMYRSYPQDSARP